MAQRGVDQHSPRRSPKRKVGSEVEVLKKKKQVELQKGESSGDEKELNEEKQKAESRIGVEQIRRSSRSRKPEKEDESKTQGTKVKEKKAKRDQLGSPESDQVEKNIENVGEVEGSPSFAVNGSVAFGDRAPTCSPGTLVRTSPRRKRDFGFVQSEAQGDNEETKVRMMSSRKNSKKKKTGDGEGREVADKIVNRSSLRGKRDLGAEQSKAQESNERTMTGAGRKREKKAKTISESNANVSEAMGDSPVSSSLRKVASIRSSPRGKPQIELTQSKSQKTEVEASNSSPAVDSPGNVALSRSSPRRKRDLGSVLSKAQGANRKPTTKVKSKDQSASKSTNNNAGEAAGRLADCGDTPESSSPGKRSLRNKLHDSMLTSKPKVNLRPSSKKNEPRRAKLPSKSVSKKLATSKIPKESKTNLRRHCTQNSVDSSRQNSVDSKESNSTQKDTEENETELSSAASPASSSFIFELLGKRKSLALEPVATDDYRRWHILNTSDDTSSEDMILTGLRHE